jgi:hypothetical protein
MLIILHVLFYLNKHGEKYYRSFRVGFFELFVVCTIVRGKSGLVMSMIYTIHWVLRNINRYQFQTNDKELPDF